MVLSTTTMGIIQTTIYWVFKYLTRYFLLEIAELLKMYQRNF